MSLLETLQRMVGLHGQGAKVDPAEVQASLESTIQAGKAFDDLIVPHNTSKQARAAELLGGQTSVEAIKAVESTLFARIYEKISGIDSIDGVLLKEGEASKKGQLGSNTREFLVNGAGEFNLTTRPVFLAGDVMLEMPLVYVKTANPQVMLKLVEALKKDSDLHFLIDRRSR